MSQKDPRADAPSHGDRMRADLKAYLDSELPPLNRWGARWHLARCAECREEVRWLQRLGEDMRDLEKATPRPELRARILASLPDAPPRALNPDGPLNLLPRRRVLSRPFAPRLAMGGALAVLVMAGAFALARSNHAPEAPRLAASDKAAPLPPSAPISQPNRLAAQPGTPQKAASRSVKPPLREDESFGRSDPFRGAARAASRENGLTPQEADRIYEAANKLYARRWTAIAIQEQRRYRELLAGSGAKPEGSPEKATDPIRLVVRVDDVPEARQQLASLLRPLHGAQSARQPGSRPEDSRQIALAPAQETPGNASVAAQPVTLRVPADRVLALLQNLEQIGELGARRSSAGNKWLTSLLKQSALKPGESQAEVSDSRLQTGAPQPAGAKPPASNAPRIALSIELIAK